LVRLGLVWWFGGLVVWLVGLCGRESCSCTQVCVSLIFFILLFS
jgi:hypothetical protein